VTTPKEIEEAAERGYPTAAQRRTWSALDWSVYNGATERLARERSLAYEEGNSPERLRELINELLVRVEALESNR